MKKKISLSLVLGILVILQFLSIIYFNYTKAIGILDLDSSLAIRHACEMWKHGIFLKDYSLFSSSLEIDCVGFFAAGVFNLTGNLPFSMALCHGISYILTFFLFKDIFRHLHGSKESFLMMVLLYFTPYAVSMLDWAQMLSFCVAQYSFRVFTMLLILDVMLMFDNDKTNKVKSLFLFALSLSVNFWTSFSCGNYILCMVILPFILAYVFDSLKHRVRFWSDPKAWFLVVSAIVSFIGWRLQLPYTGLGHRNSLDLLVSKNFAQNFGNLIAGVFQLFGGLTNESLISIFSEKGIGIVLRFVFCFLIFFILIRRLWQDKLQTKWHTYIVMVAAVNILILSVTDTSYGSATFEHRYHILWVVMALIGVSMTIMDAAFWGPDRFVTNAVFSGIIIVVIAMNVLGFRMIDNVDAKNGDKGFEKAMMAVAKKNNTNSVLVYNWSDSPSVITLIDPEMHSAYITSKDGQTYIVSYDYYLSYTENAKMTSHVVICTQEFIDAMPDYLRSCYTLVDSETFGGGINAYYASENMFDTISGLPLAADDRSIDFPYSPGYRSVGKLDETGRLIADTEESGFVLYGPNTPAVEGVYNITLEYEVLKSGERNSFFDICTNSGQQVILRSNLSNDATSFTFENVDITGSAPLEFRVWKPGDATIVIKRIVFEQVN